MQHNAYLLAVTLDEIAIVDRLVGSAYKIMIQIYVKLEQRAGMRKRFVSKNIIHIKRVLGQNHTAV